MKGKKKNLNKSTFPKILSLRLGLLELQCTMVFLSNDSCAYVAIKVGY